MSDLKRPVDVIAEHHPCLWRHIPTGEKYRVIYASPHEVLAVSGSGTWEGKASHFVREFEALGLRRWLAL